MEMADGMGGQCDLSMSVVSTTCAYRSFGALPAILGFFINLRPRVG